MSKIDRYLALTLTMILIIILTSFDKKEPLVYAQVDQGTDCLCTPTSFFDGSVCVQGTLNCLNTISDPVCGCNGSSYLNSCIAQSNAVKKFTKGDCSTTTNFVCANDDQCPLGTCPNEKTFKRFTCSNSMCTLISFSVDPCPLTPSSISSSGSGNDCRCPSGQFFNGKACTIGKLTCLNTLSDPVCSCDNFTFLNSCVAQANGIKKFTKGECSAVSTLRCFSDSDCPSGVCSDGSSFKRFTCNQEGKCTSVVFSQEPCASSSSSGAQGDACNCPVGTYFDGTSCIPGTLNCTNPVSDPVCGCNNISYLNSCTANASGIKTFTQGKCSFVTLLNCKFDLDCPLGICPNGKTYSRFSCTNNTCTQIVSSSDPCGISSSSSSSSSGNLPLSQDFTGIWKVQLSRCSRLALASSSSSGNCISCPNIKITCPLGSILTPQTCDSCPTCNICAGSEVNFALCSKNNALDGIVNHSIYLDRGIINSQNTTSNKQVTLGISNPKFTNAQEGTKDNPVNLTLKLTGKRRLAGAFNNMLYIENIKAVKLSKSGCVSINFSDNCCNGFILPSEDKTCPTGFAKSPCILSGKNKITVCCPTNICQVPCGSNCCNSNQTCVSLDPCFGDVTQFCYAPISLICQDCSSKGNCANSNSCPSGTFCTEEPDFLCKPIGCPIIESL